MTRPSADPVFDRRTSDATALHGDSIRWTYSELNSRVDAIANHLRSDGVERGTRIAITAHRDATTIASIFAAVRIGAVPVLLDPKAPLGRMHSLRAIACAEYDLVVPPNAATRAHATPETNLDRDATILFTSGSSGTPKAALHSLSNHLYSAQGSYGVIPLNSSHTWLLSLPIHHVGGLGILFRCFLAGATVAIPELGEPLDMAAIRLTATHLSCVPTQLQRIVESPQTLSLQAVLLGGARLDPDLVRVARNRGWPIFTTYGCTEMSSQICTGTRTDTSGRLLEHRRMRVADDGELLVCGKTLFKGYLTPDGLDTARDAAGWFHTGDLGELRHGELVVLGRKDSMFISGGENVQPEEIERTLMTVPGIKDAVVVSRADARFGRRPVAFLAGEWIDADLRNQLRNRLPSYMIPDAFLPLPDSDLLKPQRSALQAHVDDAN